MFKFISLALGLITVMAIAPIGRSTMVPTRPNQLGINGNLHAEKLVTIKRSTILGTTTIKGTSIKKAFNDHKVKLSASEKESQRIRTNCPQAFDNFFNRFGSNERPVGFPDKLNDNNVNSFSNVNTFNNTGGSEGCSFSRQGSW